MPTITNATLTQGSSLTVTDNVVTGTGAFDDLMEAVNIHLEAQYQLGRITGTDYATVYLGAMQSALQQSVAFVMGLETTNADVILTGKQGLKVDADKLLVDAQELLTDAQKLKVDADVVLVGKEGSKVDAEKLLVDAQELLVDNQSATELKKALDLVSTTTVRNAQSAADVTLKGKQGAKIDADKLLVDAQELKTDAEKTLISQKEITEFGQTQVSTKTAPAANSILGKQATLYGEQAKGFQWNADQKYLKTLLDAWAVNISTAGVASTQVTALNATGTGNINTQITNAEPTG